MRRFSPATRTMKNSSRLLAKIARNRARSSSGSSGSWASSSTRSLKASQDSSRSRNRSGCCRASNATVTLGEAVVGRRAAAGTRRVVRRVRAVSPGASVVAGLVMSVNAVTLPRTQRRRRLLLLGPGRCHRPTAVTSTSADHSRKLSSCLLPPGRPLPTSSARGDGAGARGYGAGARGYGAGAHGHQREQRSLARARITSEIRGHALVAVSGGGAVEHDIGVPVGESEAVVDRQRRLVVRLDVEHRLGQPAAAQPAQTRRRVIARPSPRPWWSGSTPTT